MWGCQFGARGLFKAVFFYCYPAISSVIQVIIEVNFQNFAGAYGHAYSDLKNQYS